MWFASSGYSPKWLRWSGGDELLNKVVIFVFFAYKKYSRSFIALRLNHWWQMDYFDDVFHTFLGLDSVIYLAVNGTVHKSSFHPKYLKLCSEDELSFTGLERHGGKWLITKFSFWGGVTLCSVLHPNTEHQDFLWDIVDYSCSSAEKMEDSVPTLRAETITM